MKITTETSREIYTIATKPQNRLTNREIGEKFGIDEATVRYHVKKWEGKLHEISKTNEKAAAAIAEHTVNVHEGIVQVIRNIKYEIQQARNNGVSPEKLAPLFNNWLKGLELASERLGKIDKSPIVNIQINQEFNELKAIVLSELCDNCKQKLKGRLHELVSK